MRPSVRACVGTLGGGIPRPASRRILVRFILVLADEAELFMGWVDPWVGLTHGLGRDFGGLSGVGLGPL